VRGSSRRVAERRKERLTDLVGCRDGEGSRALAVSYDVTDEGQAYALIRRAEEEFGRGNILVNNSGVMLLSKIGNGLSDQWRQMFDVNVLCTRA